MAEEQQKNRWSWDVLGFEPRKAVDSDDDHQKPPLIKRYSFTSSSLPPNSHLSSNAIVKAKLNNLSHKVQVCIYTYFTQYFRISFLCNVIWMYTVYLHFQ